MPSIKIYEIDNTSAAAVSLVENAVFVPGFVNPKFIDSETGEGINEIRDAYLPTLCTSVNEFESLFGSVPATFTERQLYSDLRFADNAIPSGKNDVLKLVLPALFEVNAMDPGYVFAKELLSIGLPVVYVRMNENASDITAKHMYDMLSEEGNYHIWEDLRDINEFIDIKYLTSGGYPTFEYKNPDTSISLSGIEVEMVEFDSEVFKAKIKFDELTGDQSCKFLYGREALNATIIVETYDDLEQYKDIATVDQTYFVKNEQKLYRIVPAFTPFKITLDSAGGDVEPAYVLTNYNKKVETLPIPSKDNYEFIGWFTFDDIEVRANDTVFEADTTIIAKWSEPVSISTDIITKITKKSKKVMVSGVIEEQPATWELLDWEYWSFGDEKIFIEDYGITFVNGFEPVMGMCITVSANVAKYSWIDSKMLACAAGRGDCVAFIDHTNNPVRPLNPLSSKSVYYAVSNINSDYRISENGEFGAMFTPWCSYRINSNYFDNSNINSATLPNYMPASFGYFKALANAVETSGSWAAIAGVARGDANVVTPAIASGLRLTNAIADSYQPENNISINPITNIKPYGYLIWGNRTLKNNANGQALTATSFLNIRNMVSDVKKLAYLAAKRFMFEQNSDILWLNYKDRITPYLDRLVSGNGLSGYKLIKEETNEKAKLVCRIKLYPVYAVEAFEITVELADDEITVS